MSLKTHHRKSKNTWKNGDLIAYVFIIISLYRIFTSLYLLKILICLLLIINAIVLGVKIYKVLRASYWKKHNKILGYIDIDQMSGLDFEQYISRLLVRHEFSNIRLTERYDYGVDIIANKNNIVWGIQVKRYSGLVKADAVRQVVTGLKKYSCSRAMVITNSYFSRVAQELAKVNDCKLIDRSTLKEWMRIF
ncbi:MAG: hypothetical protein NVSMB46_03710 [Candidatus Saccharimonadales bacterium]